VSHWHCEKTECPKLIEMDQYFGKICKDELDWHTSVAKAKLRSYYSPNPPSSGRKSSMPPTDKDWYLVGNDPEILRLKEKSEVRFKKMKEEQDRWFSEEFQEELRSVQEEMWDAYIDNDHLESSPIIRCGMSDIYMPRSSCRRCPHYRKHPEREGCLYDQGV
jgi:hypothetical protein